MKLKAGTHTVRFEEDSGVAGTLRIQEQTLTFVPKILAVFATILIGGGWMLNLMSTFTVNLWQDFSKYVR